MLACCASSGARAPVAPPPPEPDPVIEVRYETRLICPAELARPLPDRPPPGAGAVIEANEAGAMWLASELAFAASVAALFLDARAACPPPAAP